MYKLRFRSYLYKFGACTSYKLYKPNFLARKFQQYLNYFSHQISVLISILNSTAILRCQSLLTMLLRYMYEMLPDRLFSVGFLRALHFPPTAIRQMVKGQRDWIWQGSSALDSIERWRLSAIKVLIELK